MRLSNLEKTQPYMASRISEELENNKVPQSIMFLGPKFSSRMTGAIELGLNLLNESNHFQDLDVSDLIILSSRNFALRLKALRNLFSASRNKRSWDLLLRETRIMPLSCHPALSNSSDKDLFKAAVSVFKLRKLEVKNCFLCKYSGDNMYNWDDENKPVFCKTFRFPCSSGQAVGCERYRIKYEAVQEYLSNETLKKLLFECIETFRVK